MRSLLRCSSPVSGISSCSGRRHERNAGCSSGVLCQRTKGPRDRGVPVAGARRVGRARVAHELVACHRVHPWSATSGSSEMSASELRKDSGERVRRGSRRSRQVGHGLSHLTFDLLVEGAHWFRQRRAGATPGQLVRPSRIRARTNTTSSLAGLSDNMCPHSTDARPARAAGRPAQRPGGAGTLRGWR